MGIAGLSNIKSKSLNVPDRIILYSVTSYIFIFAHRVVPNAENGKTVFPLTTLWLEYGPTSVGTEVFTSDPRRTISNLPRGIYPLLQKTITIRTEYQRLEGRYFHQYHGSNDDFL